MVTKQKNAEYQRNYRDRNNTMISTIYAIRSKTLGEIVYIGETYRQLEKRMFAHFNNALDHNSTSFNGRFATAIRQLGREDFEVEVLVSPEVYHPQLTEKHFVGIFKPECNVQCGNKVRRHRFDSEEELYEHLKDIQCTPTSVN